MTKQKVPFILNYMQEWCHFYKPKDYKIEEEIRLQYLPNDKNSENIDWYIAKPINVINSFVTIEILKDTAFPLELKEIILGPKFPEADVNRGQLKALLKVNNFQNVEVNLSTIKNYR